MGIDNSFPFKKSLFKQLKDKGGAVFRTALDFDFNPDEFITIFETTESGKPTYNSCFCKIVGKWEDPSRETSCYIKIEVI